MRPALVLLGCLTAGCTTASSAPVASAPRFAQFRQAPCAPGLPEDFRCGTVGVPENSDRPQGRQIALNVAVAPGQAPRQAEPLVMIAGGPGQAAVATAPVVLPALRDLDAHRDIVFVDQRGTGASNPLTCEASFDAIMGPEGTAAVGECHRSLSARADLSAYGSDQAVTDLEAVRAALSYQRVNLVAVSYGVRVATLYMRRHPERVRSAILRAAYPSNFNIVGNGLPAADAELGRVLDECGASAECHSAYPNLEAELNQVFASLEQAPQNVTRADGSSLQVTPALFQQALYALMLSAQTRQSLPLMIHTAATRGFQPIATPLGQIRDALYGTLPVGMYLSILCSEDVPRLAPGDLQRPRTPLGRMGAQLMETCHSWAVPAADPDLFRLSELTTPTLVVSGLLDPATTASAGRGLMRQLRTGVHVELPATAHGPMLPACLREDSRRFLANPGPIANAGQACATATLPAFAVMPTRRP